MATAADRAGEAVVAGAEEAAGDVAATVAAEEATTPMPAMRDRRMRMVGRVDRRRPSRRPRPVCRPRALLVLEFRRPSRSDPADSRCRPSTLLCPRTPCRTSPCSFRFPPTACPSTSWSPRTDGRGWSSPSWCPSVLCPRRVPVRCHPRSSSSSSPPVACPPR